MKVRIDVRDRVRVFLGPTAERSLPDDVVDALKAVFTHDNPEFGKRPNAPPHEVTWRADHTDEGQWLSLPRGGMSKVRETLHRYGHEWQTTDSRVTGDPSVVVPPFPVVLWDFQVNAVESSFAKQNCIFQAPTGSGKSVAAFALISKIGHAALVVVFEGRLFDQWVRRCTDEAGMKPEDVGRVKGDPKKWTFGAITVASAKTLAVHPEFFTDHGWRFGTVVADEVQGFAADTMYRSVDPCPAKYRIGVSADSSRKDKREYLVHDLFGSVAFDISRERVEASGNILPVTIRVVPTDFRADWYRKASVSRNNVVKREAWNNLLNAITEDEDRNKLAVSLVEAEAARGHQSMVMCARIEHCIKLNEALAQSDVSSGLMLGGDKMSAEFERTRLALLSGSIGAGVGTLQAIGQAIDIPLVSRGFLCFPLAANRQKFNQFRGRICRTAKSQGKVDAELVYLWDRWVYGLTHLANLVRWYGDRVLVKQDDQWVSGRAYMKTFKHDFTSQTACDDLFE